MRASKQEAGNNQNPERLPVSDRPQIEYLRHRHVPKTLENRDQDDENENRKRDEDEGFVHGRLRYASWAPTGLNERKMNAKRF
jgi:hypothetical protein